MTPHEGGQEGEGAGMLCTSWAASGRVLPSPRTPSAKAHTHPSQLMASGTPGALVNPAGEAFAITVWLTHQTEGVFVDPFCK